jgi:hypothetical protein
MQCHKSLGLLIHNFSCPQPKHQKLIRNLRYIFGARLLEAIAFSKFHYLSSVASHTQRVLDDRKTWMKRIVSDKSGYGNRGRIISQKYFHIMELFLQYGNLFLHYRSFFLDMPKDGLVRFWRILAQCLTHLQG